MIERQRIQRYGALHLRDLTARCCPGFHMFMPDQCRAVASFGFNWHRPLEGQSRADIVEFIAGPQFPESCMRVGASLVQGECFFASLPQPVVRNLWARLHSGRATAIQAWASAA